MPRKSLDAHQDSTRFPAEQDGLSFLLLLRGERGSEAPKVGQGAQSLVWGARGEDVPPDARDFLQKKLF